MYSFKQKLTTGFTLIEVLIAFIILSFGLLGAIALQAKAKQASFDSMQRAAAIALGNDILGRIRVNDTSNLISLYGKVLTSETGIQKKATCYSSVCDDQQIADLDIEQWKRAIRARENTGALDNAIVCINPTLESGTAGKGYNIEVIVSWQGRQTFTPKTVNSDVKCTSSELELSSGQRRLVVLSSYVYLRS
ncbi:type IV pilus modification protein PilV [Pseudoalteromonas sp. MMG010]|uniref:type IV pilus modification protein PilV n=1 Tax=Pseudoalteromonas sp. MMG010 TaxID=2822685 RepID=UPI001B3A1927|nr:type IV pilus modification protein PilV [Pseudoalteromonas sp. MMG010]MBQ4833188.1 type IV pilus modification protein PilV [Pseudoalteromonas sp. MMG010]